MSNEVKVSVLCITYNQKDYISDALDSFINQKTNFKYEILVNDDCSTDGTKDIVIEYAKRYPDIIKPIFHEENQYSKGVSPIRDVLIPKAVGKYIAICEGDDYWIDNHKLQIQYDFMEKYPECSLCVHNAFLVDTEKKIIGKVKTSDIDKKIPIRDVLVEGGDFIATSSTFARLPKDKNIPSYFDILTLDYTWQIFFASCGAYTYCFEKVMSVYRQGGSGSWSSLQKTDFQAYKLREKKLLEDKCKLRKAFDRYNGGKFTDYVKEADLYDTIKCAVCVKECGELKKKKYLQYINSLKKKERLRYYLLIYFPGVFQKYQEFKKIIKQKVFR